MCVLVRVGARVSTLAVLPKVLSALVVQRQRLSLPKSSSNRLGWQATRLPLCSDCKLIYHQTWLVCLFVFKVGSGLTITRKELH